MLTCSIVRFFSALLPVDVCVNVWLEVVCDRCVINPLWICGMWDMCLCFGCGVVGVVGGEWTGILEKGIHSDVNDLDSLCRWQVQVSVLC